MSVVLTATIVYRLSFQTEIPVCRAHRLRVVGFSFLWEAKALLVDFYTLTWISQWTTTERKSNVPIAVV